MPAHPPSSNHSIAVNSSQPCDNSIATPSYSSEQNHEWPLVRDTILREIPAGTQVVEDQRKPQTAQDANGLSSTYQNGNELPGLLLPSNVQTPPKAMVEEDPLSYSDWLEMHVEYNTDCFADASNMELIPSHDLNSVEVDESSRSSFLGHSTPESSGTLEYLNHTTPVSRNSTNTFPSTPIDLQPANPQAAVGSISFPRPVVISNLKSRLGPEGRLKSKYNRCCTPEKRNSASTTDSGFYSGRGSPLTPLAAKENFHARSLHEFEGLHRVPCRSLHEPPPLDKSYNPQTQQRFKDKSRCGFCHYSGIHNLSWSVRYLKFEVFQAELNLQGIDGLEVVYDLDAVDAAGNSALHYAAAGGAWLDHFNSLIDAGANPYRLNTAGQLFLHCIRPYIRQSESNSFDVDLIEIFNADLINLLNTFQPKGAFKWPDNNGNTPLDAISARISDKEIKNRIFQYVHQPYASAFALNGSLTHHRGIKDAGYTLEVSSVLNKLRSTKHSQVQSPALDTMDKFGLFQDKQKKAWEIYGHATADPSYTDPETGENVLHALSQLRLSGPTYLRTKIQKFVLKGVDLNLQNSRRDYPLTAFIRERPFSGVDSDESGAMMSKYLDALLWKHAKERVPNKININVRNGDGTTALYYAAVLGRPDSVRSLIEAGANVNARIGESTLSESVFEHAD
jgi:ankyrin repeat protein